MAAFTGLVQVNVSKADLQMAEDSLAAIPNGAKIAIYTAINDTLRSERTDLGRRLREIINLPAAEVRDRIKVAKQATSASLEGALEVDYQKVSLRKFKGWRYHQRAGVTVQQMTNMPAMTFAYFFAGNIPNAAKQFIFSRVVGAAKYIPKHGRYANRILKRGSNKGKLMMRQPLKERAGVSVLKAMESKPGLIDEVAEDTAQKFAARLQSKVDWLLANPSATTKRKERHIPLAFNP